MKKSVLILIMSFCTCVAYTQIISPTIQGKWGIDADAQADIFVVGLSK
ncbi:hypothetical protein Niako_1691 [Niastella koreensis GR20-10]|uniref:Uncharacterized protein n=1 Tax=Niastella koreensis (strain DSM 17620 / KACC 11465 / NBRC 106392 / GR20-10) TaxID=700598 RepID=G8T988_NIAKG|nr:hypothetical protein [Niastella koreensis]AEV98056.1 hypothetical protein Niako_1691 [Niastella koreensis GR20-10]